MILYSPFLPILCSVCDAVQFVGFNPPREHKRGSFPVKQTCPPFAIVHPLPKRNSISFSDTTYFPATPLLTLTRHHGVRSGAMEEDTRDIIAVLLVSSWNLYAGNLYEELRTKALALPTSEPGSPLDYERQQLKQGSPANCTD